MVPGEFIVISSPSLLFTLATKCLPFSPFVKPASSPGVTVIPKSSSLSFVTTWVFPFSSVMVISNPSWTGLSPSV